MLLSLCLLLPVLSPSNQEICSTAGALPAPILYLSQTSAHLGESLQLKCSVFSTAPATRVVFCKDGKIISSQTGVEEKVNYRYTHAVSMGSSGNYSCGYQIKGNDNRLTRSQLSPAHHFSITSALATPTLYLSQTSAQLGDTVRLQCSVFNQAPATRIIFYKDGKEISAQTGSPKKAIYDYDYMVSSDGSGSYACGYEIKESDNRVTRSQLSPAQHLSDSNRLDLKLLLGITVPAAILVLAVSLYLLGRKARKCVHVSDQSDSLPVASLPRDLRERIQHDTSNAPEDHLHYASVTWQGKARRDFSHQPLQSQKAEMFTISKFPLNWMMKSPRRVCRLSDL